MCHLILFLPFLALPIFWWTSLSFAIPLYGFIVLISLAIYWLAYRAMHLPVQTGAEALYHQVGKVIGWKDGFYQISLNHESWNALSDETLQPGERVEVSSVHGVTLNVKRISD
ncbi:NfeD family protein [Photobacterium sp. MCCC 1A19761]|uniref:NfeD family protein n=1 Tax=Photobacterium sp. MCCC 1A19761 TaxID=3115000 RepID=UPI00307EE3BE